MKTYSYGKQNITLDDIQAVTDVLKSPYLTCGPAVKSFEQAICAYTGAKYCVAVNSATSALHIAMLAAGIGPEDEVITSPITFLASANCARYCDAIINMHTMTGTQALLWDLKIISLDKRYSKWFCDKQGLDNLEEFLAQPTPDKDGLIYWYLTHFTVFEKNFNEPGFYYHFFKTKLEKFRKQGITFELYEQINDFDALATYILNYVKSYLCHAFKRQFAILYQRYSKWPKHIYTLGKQFYRYR